MDHAWILFDYAVVLSFMLEGAWLESIGRKRDLLDHVLTPLPFGVAGMALLLLGGARWKSSMLGSWLIAIALALTVLTLAEARGPSAAHPQTGRSRPRGATQFRNIGE